jgi:hypothetical protein
MKGTPMRFNGSTPAHSAGSTKALRPHPHPPPPSTPPPTLPRVPLPQSLAARTVFAKRRSHAVDATARVMPILGAANLGKGSLLFGLVRAGVPSSWYGTPVARAVIQVRPPAQSARTRLSIPPLSWFLVACVRIGRRRMR